MPADLHSAFAQTGSGADEDYVRDTPAVLCVATHAKDAEDCALLLDALGLTYAAAARAAARQLTRSTYEGTHR